MASPGVSTKPILLISGSSPFCETFFDDEKVPKEQVVGEVNRGWDVAKYLLGYDREMISGMGLGGTGESLGAAVEAMLKDNPVLCTDGAWSDVDAQAFLDLWDRLIEELRGGRESPGTSR